MARSQALAEISGRELLSMLDEAKDESMNLRFQHVTGQLGNMQVLKRSRRQVARILTELRVREIQAAELTEVEPRSALEESGAESAESARVFKRRRRRNG